MLSLCSDTKFGNHKMFLKVVQKRDNGYAIVDTYNKTASAISSALKHQKVSPGCGRFE